MNKIINLPAFLCHDERDSVNENSTKAVISRSFDVDEIISEYTILKEFIGQSQHINPELFMHPEGIHGVNHAKRVLYLCLILARAYNIDESDKQILIEASKFHDIGRINDEDCELHGYFSVKKMIEFKVLNNTRSFDFGILKYIIENHCVSDKNALKRIYNYTIRNKEKAIKLLKLFKDADALDRVRTNDLDICYLRFSYSKRLQNVSHKLFTLIS